MVKAKKKGPTPGEVVALAAAAKVDPRTAKRALVDGVEGIRGEVVRERLRAALSETSEARIAVLRDSQSERSRPKHLDKESA